PSISATFPLHDALPFSEPRRLPRDDEVAHQRHLAATTERVAVDRGDQRFPEARERWPTARLLATQLVDRALVRHVADVGPGGEDPWTAGQPDCTHTLVRVQVAQRGSP